VKVRNKKKLYKNSVWHIKCSSSKCTTIQNDWRKYWFM